MDVHGTVLSTFLYFQIFPNYSEVNVGRKFSSLATHPTQTQDASWPIALPVDFLLLLSSSSSSFPSLPLPPSNFQLQKRKLSGERSKMRLTAEAHESR